MWIFLFLFISILFFFWLHEKGVINIIIYVDILLYYFIKIIISVIVMWPHHVSGQRIRTRQTLSFAYVALKKHTTSGLTPSLPKACLSFPPDLGTRYSSSSTSSLSFLSFVCSSSTFFSLSFLSFFFLLGKCFSRFHVHHWGIIVRNERNCEGQSSNLFLSCVLRNGSSLKSTERKFFTFFFSMDVETFLKPRKDPCFVAEILFFEAVEENGSLSYL